MDDYWESSGGSYVSSTPLSGWINDIGGVIRAVINTVKPVLKWVLIAFFAYFLIDKEGAIALAKKIGNTIMKLIQSFFDAIEQALLWLQQRMKISLTTKKKKTTEKDVESDMFNFKLKGNE